MLIQIHMIQNHSPANLNRDDLGAPKTCYFGGVIRSRISSQCLKRSIRLSKEFSKLKGGVRTRKLLEMIEDQLTDKAQKERAQKILLSCGLASKKKQKGKKDSDGSTEVEAEHSDVLVFTTIEAIQDIIHLLNCADLDDEDVKDAVLDVITKKVHSPDIALCGRMLKTDQFKTNTEVEAALQVAHAISTHAARPEIDYFIAADDFPGEDSGAGHVGESLFASACFYKYFAIDWDQLVKNLNGNNELAAHTVGAFIMAAANTNPSGKQNSYAAHNYPDCILVEIKDSPMSYANAFARPITLVKDTDLVELSIGHLANYIRDINLGYSTEPINEQAVWFSPNGRYPLSQYAKDLGIPEEKQLNELIKRTLDRIGYNWDKVQTNSVITGS